MMTIFNNFEKKDKQSSTFGPFWGQKFFLTKSDFATHNFFWVSFQNLEKTIDPIPKKGPDRWMDRAKVGQIEPAL